MTKDVTLLWLLHSVETTLEMIEFILLELPVQKQVYDVRLPSSPQPELIPRTMVLRGSTAHDVSCE